MWLDESAVLLHNTLVGDCSILEIPGYCCAVIIDESLTVAEFKVFMKKDKAKAINDAMFDEQIAYRSTNDECSLTLMADKLKSLGQQPGHFPPRCFFLACRFETACRRERAIHLKNHEPPPKLSELSLP